MIEFRPARLPDIPAIVRFQPRKLWKGIVTQVRSHPAWTLCLDGAPQLIVGVVPYTAGVLELWMFFAPGFSRAPRFKSMMRLCLMHGATVCPDHILLARIDDRNAPSRKMAELVGFVPMEEHLPGTTIRTWIRPALDAET
ncbi:hypothetical protein NA8A_04798 [Nitratireductor indicus C115]|uniref:N-acetyltransferase domain-containing protein n=2 Tax=Nitratireductor indicus TaxID=721133 RepID=K2P7W0_9HYPH|nr:hypothetical protein NA8A_04798 [Nitratireductor indicus C115]